MATVTTNVKRCFIVGSARSGTTLLQAMLANHPEVHSFPETHFFCEGSPRGRWRRRLGLVRRSRTRSAALHLLEIVQRPELEHYFPKRSPMFRAYGRAFASVLDRATLDIGKAVWVEKTPHHIDFIPAIERTVSDAVFIHLVRDGRDVLASQRHANQQDPAYWGDWPIARLVAQWNMDVRISLSYANEPAHLIASYEDLLDDTESSLRRITGFMGIGFDGAMLRHWEAAERVVGFRKDDPWMQAAFRPVADTRLKKFMSVFSDEERRRVTGGLLWGGDARQRIVAGHV